MTDPSTTDASPPTEVGVTDTGTPVYDSVVAGSDPTDAGSAPAAETTVGPDTPDDTTQTLPTSTADAPVGDGTAEASTPDPSAALPDAPAAEGSTGRKSTKGSDVVTAITPDNPPEPAQHELFAEHDSDDLGIGQGFGQGVTQRAFPDQGEAFISEVPERDDDVASDTISASPKWVAYRNFGQYKIQLYGWVGPEGIAFGVDELDEFKAFIASL